MVSSPTVRDDAYGAFVASQRVRMTTESGFEASVVTAVPIHLSPAFRPTTWSMTCGLFGGAGGVYGADVNMTLSPLIVYV